MNKTTSQFTHGLAAQGPWLLAWASQVGSRHLAHGKPCEDSLGHRFHANQSIALAVGDGVSGGAAGHVASFAAVRYCTDFAPPPICPPGQATHATAQTTIWNDPPAPNDSPLQHHLNGLDDHVQHAIAQHTGRAGASTMAAVWLNEDGTGWLTHLGDVRAYRLSPASPTANAVQHLTLDHTYANLGEAPPPYVPENNPARMAGNGFAGNPPCDALTMEVGQALLLCTDGIHGFAADSQIANLLVPSVRANAPMQPHTATLLARRLLRLALQQGSDDDMAVLLLWRLAAGTSA